ncbi:MAG: haloacid dehalogenase-like hydrolase [Leptospiraceae bacterium]|nr:haloacid dehalogenase-like hydrolase [Leptospiraceae bacterium]
MIFFWQQRSLHHSKELLLFAALTLPVLLGLQQCRAGVYLPIEGFDKTTNQKLADFFERSQLIEGRKVAIFDGDGTTMGQAPHYLADECLFEYAAGHPDRKPAVIKQMQQYSNVSLPYVQLRVKYLAGMSLTDVRNLGQSCFDRLYAPKVFKPMQSLTANLKRNGFEVWIVTASPEALYQQFLSRAYDIPITNIIGVRSVIRDGIVTDEILQPVPQDHGKKEAIESFIQARPQLAGGNSRGDKEMIEFSSDLKLIINPDTHIGHDQKESIADYARRNGWLIASLTDEPPLNFPAVSSAQYGIRINKSQSGHQP